MLSDVRPADYADTLLHLAVYHQESLSAAGSIGLFVLRWKLEDRIRQLLDRRRDQRVHLTSRSRWGVLVSACVFLAAASTLQIGPRAQAEKEQLPAARTETTGPTAQTEPGYTRAAREEQAFIEGIAVDVAGKPLEGVEVRSGLLGQGVALTGSDGRFRLPRRREHRASVPPLLAQSTDRSLIGFSEQMSANMIELARSSGNASVRLVLEPARTVRVEVTTSDGKPTAGARVEALGSVIAFPGSTTDRKGEATIQLHPQAPIFWIIAWKDDVGFDYFENYWSFPSCHRPDPPPKTVALTLQKPHRIRIRTIDSADRPVAGVFVKPWLLGIPGKRSYLNLSASSLTLALSDQRGTCDFCWLPADSSRKISFVASVPGYHCADQPGWDPEYPQEPVTCRLLRNAEVSGAVRFPDGKPAPGIAILGEGYGASLQYFRGSAKTAADGTYRLSIAPHRLTIIAVANRDWAAASHTAIQLDEGKSCEHLDFVLSRGTRIRGRVTAIPDPESAGKATVTLVEQGEHLGPQAWKCGYERGNLVRWARVDDKGNYEFRVGPGEFTLDLHPGGGEISVRVTDQPELIYSDTAASPAPMRITGRVVNAADGKPVAEATVYGESVGRFRYASFEARTGSNGEFTLDRLPPTDMYSIYARAVERGLAGFTLVPSGRKEVTVELHPAAAVVGYVHNTDGKPIEGRKVTATISCSQTGPIGIDVHALTGKDGRYCIPGLAVGSGCTISIQYDRAVPSTGTRVPLDRPGEIEVRRGVPPGQEAAPAKATPLGGGAPVPRLVFATLIGIEGNRMQPFPLHLCQRQRSAG